MDERSSLRTVSKRGCFSRNARARKTHVEATLNHPFPAQVFAVGTYKGEKWFGWYFCGPAVTITRKGIPWILKESYEYDKKFEKLVKKAMVAAGVLKDGDVYYYKQEASCDYTWFHTGDDVESIHGSLVQYYEERNETTTEDNSRSAQ